MNRNEYNGWTNYETWLVNMWIDNDEGSSDMWRERAQECWNDTDEDDDIDTRKRDAKYALSAMLKSDYESGAEDTNCTGFWLDLINASLSEVNWDEIASAICDSIEA